MGVSWLVQGPESNHRVLVGRGGRASNRPALQGRGQGDGRAGAAGGGAAPRDWRSHKPHKPVNAGSHQQLEEASLHPVNIWREQSPVRPRSQSSSTDLGHLACRIEREYTPVV